MWLVTFTLTGNQTAVGTDDLATDLLLAGVLSCCRKPWRHYRNPGALIQVSSYLKNFAATDTFIPSIPWTRNTLSFPVLSVLTENK